MTAGEPGAILIRGDARHLPLADGSVDLVVSSPPYFSFRDYEDAGGSSAGQIGAEPTPAAFLRSLWSVMDEVWRVLKPEGSAFVNLGDKSAGSGAPGTSGIQGGDRHRDRAIGELRQTTTAAQRRATGYREEDGPRQYPRQDDARDKSLLDLPGRFALGCAIPDPYRTVYETGAELRDAAGPDLAHPQWIRRADLIWNKPNGIPEPVTDRVRWNHEEFVHLTKNGRYFANIDELREPHVGREHSPGNRRSPAERNDGMDRQPENVWAHHPLGRVPGDVWTIPTEGSRIPPYIAFGDAAERGPSSLLLRPQVWALADANLRAGRPLFVRPVDHFAAFPQEWPRRLILGWTPNGICLECGTGRKLAVTTVQVAGTRQERSQVGADRQSAMPNRTDLAAHSGRIGDVETYATGYVCACTPYTDHDDRRPGDFHRTPKADRDKAGRSEDGPERNRAYAERVKNPPPGPVREYHLDGWKAPPTRPAVVLDPFSGTGTTTMVARALGRRGVGVDLSLDYCRIGSWRVFQSHHGEKSIQRTHADRQTSLFG